MESWLRRTSYALGLQNSNTCSQMSRFFEEQLVLLHCSKAETTVLVQDPACYAAYTKHASKISPLSVFRHCNEICDPVYIIQRATVVSELPQMTEQLKTAEIRLDHFSPFRRHAQQEQVEDKELKGPPALFCIFRLCSPVRQLFLPDRETIAGQMNTLIKAIKRKATVKMRKTTTGKAKAKWSQ